MKQKLQIWLCLFLMSAWPAWSSPPNEITLSEKEKEANCNIVISI